MKRSKIFKRFTAAILCAAMIFNLSACSTEKETAKTKEGYHLVTDVMKREVMVPDNVQRIAAMNGPTYEMCLCLGAADRVVLTKKPQTSNYPAALLVDPHVAEIEGFNNINPSAIVNIEDYLSRKIELALYYNNEQEVQKFDTVGIAAVVPILSTSDLGSLEECLALPLDDYKKRNAASMQVVAQALGGDSLEIFTRWEAYTNKLIDLIHERTKDLTDEERPTVYWGNTWGENVLASYFISNRAYEINLAGGKVLGPTTGSNFPEINEEQLYQWNPDFILIDNHGNSPDLVVNHVMTKEKYAKLKAVRNEHVLRIPAGVFFLDKGSTTALMTLWLATSIHPELFADISMTEELKKYYREFYSYELSEEDANHILDGWYYSSGEANE